MPLTDATVRGPRVVGAYLQTLLDTVEASGASLTELATAAGLPLAAISPTPEMLAVPDYLRLLNAGETLLCDPYFGLHVGERMKLATYAVYGMIVLSCRTFGEAVAQVMRYEVLAHDLGRSDIRFDGDEAEYVWRSPWLRETPCRHLAESITAGIKIFVDWMAGRQVPVIEIGFAHPAPADLSEYERIFQCPVKFGTAENYARFKAEILGWSVANAEPSLFPVLVQHAEQLLQAREQANQLPLIVVEVKEAIIRNLGQDRARLNWIADELDITVRTLQRKLKDAHTSFQAVLDTTRRELAEHYLGTTTLTLTDIAFLLGYQEQSSFNHAFKEWTGTNPGAWRLQRNAA